MWEGRKQRRNAGIQKEKEECGKAGMKEGMLEYRRKRRNVERQG